MASSKLKVGCKLKTEAKDDKKWQNTKHQTKLNVPEVEGKIEKIKNGRIQSVPLSGREIKRN